ncbi:DUF1524 domain-containing protein [Streptomyces seoulensis]
MTKNTTLLRALGLALLTVLPLLSAVPAHAAAPVPAAAVPAESTMPVAEALRVLPVATESREGYVRTKFKHWVDADRDGCNTRAEVLIEEAVTAPAVGAGCRLTGGSWRSYYDDATLTDASGLDIDHMVPLAEAWDSGASAWSAERRQAYANDLDAARSLVAVSARSNRSKRASDLGSWCCGMFL